MATTSRRRIDGDVEDEIIELALNRNWTPAQIYRNIDSQKELMGRVPTRRTVERKVSEIRRDAGEAVPWTLAESDGEEARLVLRSRRALILHSEKALHRFDVTEAEWVVRISKAAPDLAPDLAWVIGQVYRRFSRLVKKGNDDDFISALDDYLAFAPWRDAEHYGLYLNAVEQGWVTKAPMWSRLVEQQSPSGRPQTFA